MNVEEMVSEREIKSGDPSGMTVTTTAVVATRAPVASTPPSVILLARYSEILKPTGTEDAMDSGSVRNLRMYCPGPHAGSASGQYMRTPRQSALVIARDTIVSMAIWLQTRRGRGQAWHREADVLVHARCINPPTTHESSVLSRIGPPGKPVGEGLGDRVREGVIEGVREVDAEDDGVAPCEDVWLAVIVMVGERLGD